MIVTNLKNLITQKKISINKLSQETGISRPALTALINNESKGIQFDTLEKLTTYLNVSISDILVIQNEEVVFSFKSTIPLSQIKASEKLEKNKNRKDGFVEYNPSELLPFEASITENGYKNKSFNFAVSPMKSQGKILTVSIFLYRTNEGESVSDLNIFLGKLDTDAAIRLTSSVISVWTRFYSELENLNNLFTNLLLIEINLVGRKTRIPLVASVEKINANNIELNFDMFRQNSPIKGNSEYSKRIQFLNLD